MTTNEKLKNYQDCMGEEVGRVFYFLSNELIWLNFKWNEYETLYSKQSRVNILNKSAPFFFLFLSKSTVGKYYFKHC